MSPIITTPNRQRSKAAPYMPSYMGEGQLCVVCGDLATGLHYRAITCEGCKGFFRRTAQRHLTYTCKGDERCEINKHTRNVCQRCRYLKCVSEGMSNDLVLNDTERVQKRELIKENRERRQLETILNRMKEPTIHEGAARELRVEIDRITKLYCQLIDQPISDLAPTKGAESRMTEMLRPIIRRSTSFAKELGVWDKLPLTSQMELIHSSLLEVQILRFVSFFDEAENCFRPTEQVFLRKHDLLETLQVDVMDTDDSDQLSLLVSGLFSLARSLASCQLDHRQLAVLSAIFIFNPDNLADMDTASLLTGYQTRLWDMFRLLSDESCDSPDIHRWPRLLARCAQLRVLCARLAKHFTAANVELFSAVLVV